MLLAKQQRAVLKPTLDKTRKPANPYLQPLNCATEYSLESPKPLNRKTLEVWGVSGLVVNPRKMEHGFRMIRAGSPYTFP